jgi:hypothetical protein
MTMDKSLETRRHLKRLRDFLGALRDLNDVREVVAHQHSRPRTSAALPSRALTITGP